MHFAEEEVEANRHISVGLITFMVFAHISRQASIREGYGHECIPVAVRHTAHPEHIPFESALG
jgi:hypothetical protein